MEIYQEGFSNWEDVKSNFQIDHPEPDQVLLAIYSGGGYEGDATVFYRIGTKYYQVSGSHCSCYGLEGQWLPEEFDSKELFVAYLENLKPYYNEDQIKEVTKQLKG